MQLSALLTVSDWPLVSLKTIPEQRLANPEQGITEATIAISIDRAGRFTVLYTYYQEEGIFPDKTPKQLPWVRENASTQIFITQPIVLQPRTTNIITCIADSTGISLSINGQPVADKNEVNGVSIKIAPLHLDEAVFDLNVLQAEEVRNIESLTLEQLAYLAKADPLNAQVNYNYAQALASNCKFSLARKHYELSRSQYPSNPEIDNSLAITLIALKEYELALYTFKNALDVSTNLPKTHFNIGHLLSHELAELGRFDEALENYQHAIELRPDDIPTRLELIRLLIKHLDGSELAHEHLEYLLELMKRDGEKNSYAGLYLVSEGILVDWARKFLEEAVKSNPDSEAYHFNLFNIISSNYKTEHKVIRRELYEIIRINKYNAQAKYNLAISYFFDMQEMIKSKKIYRHYYEAAVALDPSYRTLKNDNLFHRGLMDAEAED